MTKVLVTTVVRSCPDRNNGFVYEIDWTHKRILHQQLIPSPELVELGPRGGARGARGAVCHRGHYYIANFNTIFVFNEQWQLVSEIAHPLFNGLHEIEADDDGLWVTSTGIDAVLKVDWTGRLQGYYPLTGPEGVLARAGLTVPERPIDPSADYRQVLFPNSELVTHVNSISLYDGKPYLGTNKQGLILELETNRIVVPPAGQTGFHNGSRISPELCVALSSHQNKMIAFSNETGEPVLEFDWLTDLQAAQNASAHLLEQIFTHEDTSPEVARSGWTRGLALLEPPFRFLVGVSPALIVELDLAQRTIIDLFQISENICESVHGLTICE